MKFFNLFNGAAVALAPRPLAVLLPRPCGCLAVAAIAVAAADDDDRHCGASARHTCGYNLAGPLPHVVCRQLLH